jgi:vancomycin permeability regulator SanA
MAGMTTILIFGAAVRPNGKPSTTLQRRVETAIACAKHHPNVRFIPTGGVGRHGPSEASVMAAQLMESGVPRDRILLEETGTDTLSSVRAIYGLMREQNLTGHVMVATSPYHLPRCLVLLCICGIAATPCRMSSKPGGPLWMRWYWRLREIPALPYDAALLLGIRMAGRL